VKFLGFKREEREKERRERERVNKEIKYLRMVGFF